ncbi:MAG: hypothetical protein ABIS01_09185 [Ferruginibacter sp.]
MILKLKSSLVLILFSILFYSCQKEYSLEGHLVGGTAVFTFSGGPGTCTNALVTGTYQVGTTLGAANVVTVSVNVTTIGTYSIATNALNGISFTGSGSFTTAGTQTISLTGTGIPVASGTFSYTPGTANCSFPVIVAGGAGSSVFTLNGAPGNCTGVTTGGTYVAGTALIAANIATVGVTVATPGTYNITTNTVNGITFSASGSFSAAGNQVVQLAGSGTPIAAGTFGYVPGTNGCTFSITATAGTGTAVFTYGGATGACTSAISAGTFTAGIPLTAANTMTIGVNVTTLGTYSISTATSNGISFGGSGSFSTLGPNTVVLVATGTPLVAGLFSYTPSINGCSFPVTVVANTPTDFLTCTIDGIARTFNMDLSGTQTSADTFDITAFETLALNSPVFVIEISKKPFTTTGLYNRLNFGSPNNTFSLAGYFNDATIPNGWITAALAQTGPFSVNVTGFTTTRITGTFSGTLYDNNGLGVGMKIITAGQFSIPY